MGQLPFYGTEKKGPPLRGPFLVGRPRLERGTNWLKATCSSPNKSLQNKFFLYLPVPKKS